MKKSPKQNFSMDHHPLLRSRRSIYPFFSSISHLTFFFPFVVSIYLEVLFLKNRQRFTRDHHLPSCDHQATATVPARTDLLGEEEVLLSLSDLDAEEEDEEDIFHFFLSLASSISICSCLHSLLQNGVSPLQKWPNPMLKSHIFINFEHNPLL